MSFGRVPSQILAVALLTLPLLSCSGSPSDSVVLTADMPLHLEEHLDVATIEGSEVPTDLPEPMEWRFDEPQPEWTSARLPPLWTPVQTRTDDALRVTLTEAHRFAPWESLVGAIYVDLPDWRREDWAHVVVRARTSEEIGAVGVDFNLEEEAGTDPDWPFPFRFLGEYVRVIHDGSVQTYRLRADWSGGMWEGPWRQLVLAFSAEEPASIDLLSVSVTPKEATYASEPAGVRAEVRDRAYRRTLYTHTPGRLEYRVRVPEVARLDVGLGVLRDDAPVTFRITAKQEGAEAATLLEETHSDKERWVQHSLDLSSLAGQTVTLSLEAEAEKPGTVALWAAPTLTGAREADKPNVIFYVIDGGAADHMSIYGYNRRTTSSLERLAAEGAVFENAYSNSSWTMPSTASFMTSLQHSVLGGYKNRSNPVPEEAVTMAEHMHGAGYQTAVFVANPNAGTLSGLERGVDVFQEDWTNFTYFGREHHAESSRVLHEAFWRWRETYPAAPYWVHFQTTDVHRPWRSVAPFAGLFVSPELRETFGEWDEQLRAAEGPWFARFEGTGIDRVTYYDAGRGLYDETMAHQDHQLGKLVERLKAQGEWENTLLIVAADHSTGAAGSEFGRGMQDSVPPEWGPMFRSSVSRAPLMVVWPGRIAGGQRFSQPVSMVDVLPTILDLVGLPRPEVMQGRSLAPLLMGEEGWEKRPVILDEFVVVQETGEFRGRIEVIDGRWGASLEINPDPEQEHEEKRPAPLLLYDLWNDPLCLKSLHEDRPDLVEKYTAFLEAQWEAHQALAHRFTRSGEVTPLTPEQLETLRALGYIQ
ncbi:MAG: sulfatase [Dehalococcoidia bacterium]